MSQLEQENQELRGEVNALKESLERPFTIMEVLLAAQNQLSPTLTQRTVILEVVSTPISVAPVSAPQIQMPSVFPWGMPPNYV